VARFHLRLDRAVDHARRYRHILAVLVKYGFQDVSQALGGRLGRHVGRAATPAAARRAAAAQSRPVRFRLALEEMGPTFIKLGQLLSTRPDVVPETYVRELERLQDQVAPEPPGRIRRQLAQELGGDLDAVFPRFDPKPLAAGSIAQVHRATTKDGDDVVVKVRRPDMVRTLRTECEILQTFAGVLKVALFESDTVDPRQMVSELTQALLKEADLTNERRNQQRFARNFADDPTVHVPAVYEAYCTEGVLTMEYIDGIRSRGGGLAEAGLDRRVLARRGADFVLRQIFEHGFFHTDPHPGNFFFLPDNVLVPLDFGQMASLTRWDRELLTDVVLGVVDADARGIVRALDRAELLGDEDKADALARDLSELLETYRDLPLKEISLRVALGRGFEVIRRNRVRPPSEFTLMMKALMTIQSFAAELDPQFQVVEYVRPYARRLVLRRLSPSAALRNLRRTGRELIRMTTSLPQDVSDLADRLRKGRFNLRVHHEHLENLSHTLDKSSNRISFALIIAALLIASSMLVAQQGTVLRLVSLETLGVIGYLAAAVLGLWLLVSIVRSRHY